MKLATLYQMYSSVSFLKYKNIDIQQTSNIYHPNIEWTGDGRWYFKEDNFKMVK